MVVEKRTVRVKKGGRGGENAVWTLRPDERHVERGGRKSYVPEKLKAYEGPGIRRMESFP